MMRKLRLRDMRGVARLLTDYFLNSSVPATQTVEIRVPFPLRFTSDWERSEHMGLPAPRIFPFLSHHAASLLENSQEVCKCGRGWGWSTCINSWFVRWRELQSHERRCGGIWEKEWTGIDRTQRPHGGGEIWAVFGKSIGFKHAKGKSDTRGRGDRVSKVCGRKARGSRGE